MPIPITELERAILPRILTASTTFEELLYLFDEQPGSHRMYAVIRIAADAYDVLALADLYEAIEKHGAALLPMTVAWAPGLLRPAPPVWRERVGKAAAERAKAAAPRRRLVVLDEANSVLGVLVTTFTKGGGPQLPPTMSAMVLGDSQSMAPHLNTRFDGLAPDQAIVVGQRVPLIVWVGEPTAINRNTSSSRFTFDFPADSRSVEFTVRVHGDPADWAIRTLQPTMIVAAPGETTQEAEFQVIALRSGSLKLHISVERADTRASLQDIWLTLAVMQPNEVRAQQAVIARRDVSLPLDAGDIKRRSVRIVLQDSPRRNSFRALVDADLPRGPVYKSFDLPVSARAIRDATLRLRQELRKVVFFQLGVGAEARYPFANLATLDVDEAVARQAIAPLADAAQQIWNLLFHAPRSSDELRQIALELRELPYGSTIRVVLESEEIIIPWALLYDEPGPITPATLTWSGFWGYRYILDTLPPNRYPPPDIQDAPPKIQMLFNDDANLRRFIIEQEQYTRAELGAAHIVAAHGDGDVRQALSSPSDAALVYFYCHGDHRSGAAKRPPDQEMPLASESRLFFSGGRHLRLADLRRMPAAPLLRRPLVFLNACEGATQYPFYYDGFMPYFIEEQGARGFIGTEVKAPQLLGHDFALRFLRAFAEGRRVGEICWQLRRFYLDTHNTILGFNYSLYCPAEVRLLPPLLARAEQDV